MLRKTPVAWLQLIKEKTRLLVAIAGIGFADMLMFVQLGFLDSLYDSATLPHRALQADLVITNPQFKSLTSVQSFSRERLYQAQSDDDVASVSSIYIGMGDWKNPETRLKRSILVWGVEPTLPSFDLPGLAEHTDSLKQLNQVLFDQAGRPEYGPIPALLQQGQVDAELNRQTVQVAGLFTMGSSFVADGNIITSDSTFLKLYQDRRSDQVDIGLIQLKPGVDLQQVQARLAAALPPDVRVLTVEEFAAVEKHYWESQGTIGFIFGIGVVVGFIVGTVIVYQILYTDVANHLPEYATLKAMGYDNRYLLTMLLQEALLLAAFGYIPGFAVAVGLYHLTHAMTLLPIGMTMSRAVTVFILTLIMCSVSGAVASQKLRSADPADIF
ncbi:FtsX-like permease family protein [Leptolyngbya sp. NK1-12]|uniref:FtsX-like permease family protein n=1 Tax=Leptolyngbya sp. NK1-12 TaxID=2547451 RepID=A0AA97AKA6_9CYAN|nr:ABC transporter permease DevC [Leptolyngbya sp. NK1-12]WNZ25861.1 FtsX-like permease family protein [Leptolyngbya sp. NK1-12]